MSMRLASCGSKAMAGSRAELYRMVSVAVQTVPDAFLFSFQGPFWDYVNSRDLGELQIHRMRGRKQKVPPFFTEEASAQGPLEKIHLQRPLRQRPREAADFFAQRRLAGPRR